MKTITIKVADEQYEFARQLIESLDWTELRENEVHEDNVPEWHKTVVRNRIKNDDPEKRYTLQEIVEGIRIKRGL